MYCCKQYTILTLIWDLFMLCITGGLWFFWILIREHNRRRCC